MDSDDDIFPPDQTAEFLKNKLKEVKTYNEQLCSALQTRKTILNDLNLKLRNNQKEFLFVKDIWKKIWNGKYAIGINVTLNDKNAKITSMWTWDSSEPVSCNLHKFILDKDKSEVLLVASFNKPDFSRQLVYNLRGVLVCDSGLSGETLQHVADLPEITMQAEDLHKTHIQLNVYDIYEGNVQDVCALISCSISIEFTMHLPRYFPPDEDILTGMFKKVLSVDEITYYALRSSNMIGSGCLIGIKQLGKSTPSKCHIKLYSRDENSEEYLIHCVHKDIPGVLLLPPLEPDLISILEENEELNRAQIYNRNVTTEKDFLEGSLLGSDTLSSSDKIKQFRLHLALLEYRTDTSYNDIYLGGSTETNDMDQDFELDNFEV